MLIGERHLEVIYKSRQIEAYCTIAAKAERKYGIRMAGKIQQRIAEIRAADTVEMMIACTSGDAIR